MGTTHNLLYQMLNYIFTLATTKKILNQNYLLLMMSIILSGIHKKAELQRTRKYLPNTPTKENR